MERIKYITIGIAIGSILGAGIAWAASSFVWVNDAGRAMGTASNPVYITSP